MHRIGINFNNYAGWPIGWLVIRQLEKNTQLQPSEALNLLHNERCMHAHMKWVQIFTCLKNCRSYFTCREHMQSNNHGTLCFLWLDLVLLDVKSKYAHLNCALFLVLASFLFIFWNWWNVFATFKICQEMF